MFVDCPWQFLTKQIVVISGCLSTGLQRDVHICAMAWTEDDFEKLLWYVTAEPTPKGYLEQGSGIFFSPSAAYASLLEGARGGGNRARANAAWVDIFTSPSSYFAGIDATAARAAGDGAVPGVGLAAEAGAGAASGDDETSLPPARLATLIAYLEDEVEDKDLRSRGRAWHDSPQPDELLRGADGLVGQEALDVYVAELVARLRDFPYHRLEGGGEVGAWVRDVLLVPSFRGRWDFYNNKKAGAGFDLPSLAHVLCDQDQILDRLRYALVYTGN